MNHPLSMELARQIRPAGLIRFDEFMQTALYHPEHGFYASGQTRTGSQGDFLTPVSAGPVLGQLLARQADEWHAALGRPSPVYLCEQGADRGLLAHDVLDAIAAHHPSLRVATQLHILEPSVPLTKQQRHALDSKKSSFSIHWHPQLETFSPADSPCFFYSCELVDSFPVRLARYERGSWHELGVTLKRDQFVWAPQTPSADLLAEVKRWNIPPIEGFTAEIRPAAGPWVRGLGQKIQQGIFLTMDYGMPASDLYHPTRSSGTLVAMQKHQRSDDPLHTPGRQDLTSHVNYTELIEEGEKEGLRFLGLADFSSAWTRLAKPLLSENQSHPPKWTRNFQHLTHPGFFGKTHQVLVQGKNLPKDYQPSLLQPISA